MAFVSEWLDGADKTHLFVLKDPTGTGSATHRWDAAEAAKAVEVHFDLDTREATFNRLDRTGQNITSASSGSSTLTQAKLDAVRASATPADELDSLISSKFD